MSGGDIELFGALRGHALRCIDLQWPSGSHALTYLCECGKRYGSIYQLSQKAAYQKHRVHKHDIWSAS